MFDDFEKMLAPYWAGDIVYEESFLPLNEAGDDTDAPLSIPLLYTPSKILSVTDPGRTTIFEEGRDYRLENGRLILPHGSLIQKMPWCEYVQGKDSSMPFLAKNGGKMFFGEGTTMYDREYCVTYRHTDSWNLYTPKSNPALLPKTRARLKRGEPFLFGWFGDSITTGANSTEAIGQPPFIPIFPRLTTMQLQRKYNCDITYVNHAVGGTATPWGCERFPKDFMNEVPDLLFIGFGMNDASGGIPPRTFIENIRTMCTQALELNPECELLLCSTTLPNPLAPQFYRDHITHEPLLAEVCRELGSRCALVPMTSVHRALLSRKHFYDMTGNNINHPNDFLARAYAQTILTVIEDV